MTKEKDSEVKIPPRPNDTSADALGRYHAAMRELPGVLAMMGFESMRPGQDRAVKNVMAERDTVVILPTSTGKSACFVIPTLCHKWRTIVIYPLVALMRDQAQSMQEKGLSAASISSQESDAHNASVLQEWAAGTLQFMLVSPERFANEEWASVVSQFPPDFVAMDECFTGDVEVLTENGFVRFDELKEGVRVAQVNPETKHMSFVLPTKLIDRPHNGEVIHIYSDKGVDLTVTPNHDLLRYRRGDEAWQKVKAGAAKFSYHWKFLAAPMSNDGRDELTPRERLQVAYQADGNRHSKSYASFSFSKSRKINRFLQLMEDGGFDWAESNDNDPMGRRRFLVRDVPWLSKQMRGTVNLEELSTRGCRALVDEAIAWDGSGISDSLGYYSSTVEGNTDFFQEACIMSGLRSRKTKQVDDRKDSYKDVHRLFIRLGEPWIDTQDFVTKRDPQFRGRVYCVSVPEGCIVVRRAGKPVVVGNCHTFHEWADNFRPGYKFAGEFIRKTQPKVVAAFSATLSEEAEEQAREGLGIPEAKLVYHYPRRENLILETHELSPRECAPWVAENCFGPTIVYASTRKRTEQYAEAIARYTDRQVYCYHGGMKQTERRFMQDKFMQDPDGIISATNAFGMGVDKALPMEARILTPCGWKKNSELAVGDEVVGADGRPTRITRIVDRGCVKSYKLTFSDKSETVCADDHVWAVRTPWEKYAGKGFTPRTTSEIRACIKDSSGNNKWFIPLVNPVEFADNGGRPLHPYLLGLLLGDGGMSTGNCVRFHKDDQFLLGRILELMPAGGSVRRYDSCNYGLVYGKGRRNPVLDHLRDLGLSGLSSPDKFVPESYLWAPVSERISLLQGLMDSDGGPSGGGGCGAVFCSSSPRLIEAVMFLSRSLGGVPTRRKLCNGDYWQVYLRLPDGVQPFALPRKADRIKTRTKYEPTRALVDVEELPPQLMQCLTVEADDGLFVTEDFVVTHNCDVRNVVHFDIPGTLVALAQEVGRAGRDGNDSRCVIIPSQEGVRTRKYFIRCGNPTASEIKKFVKAALQMREGKSGAITATRDAIAERAGVDKFAIQAIMAFCLGERIFMHDETAARQSRVRFAETIPSMTSMEMETRDAIYDVGLEKDGWWHFDIEALSEQCAREPATVMGRLRKMADKGAIDWVRASSRRPLRPGIDLLDVPQSSFDRLDEKAAQANADLELVLEYMRTPDDEKHDFLESHLNR